MKQWFVIKTKPNKESSVHTLLFKAGIPCFFPKIKNPAHQGLSTTFKATPLFPSYLFINADFSSADNIRLIKYTRGVSRILCADNRPLPMDGEIIKILEQKTDKDGFVRQPSPLKPGDCVQVRKGLLKDLIGILEKPVSPQGRVIVLLNLINYKIKATLHWSELERLNLAA